MVYLAEATVDARVCANRTETADLQRLGDEIAELAAHLHAAMYRLLVMLREFDEREGWGGGFRSALAELADRDRPGRGTGEVAGRPRVAAIAADRRSDEARRAVLRKSSRDHTRCEARQ